MRHAIRRILIHSGSFLCAYVALTGTCSFLLAATLQREMDMPWALFWMIWVFAYWPMALGAAFIIWTLRPPPRLAAALHTAYIAAALLALYITATLHTWWPMFALKITGLSFIFYCITGFRRRSGE